MKAATVTRVRGAQYYPTNELIQRGMLVVGASIRLEAEPHNEHDKNAVLVRLARTGDKIGHLSRDIAPRYARLLASGKIVSTEVVNVESGRYPNVGIKITYSNDKAQSERPEINLLRHSTCNLPHAVGVYALTNTRTGRVYIGSSSDISDRALHHCAELESERHPNKLLSDDFERYGANAFRFSVVTRTVSIGSARADEERAIQQIISTGGDLYNMTSDGAGIKDAAGFSPDPRSISDRRSLVSRRVESRIANPKTNSNQAEGVGLGWWIVGIVLVLLFARCK